MQAAPGSRYAPSGAYRVARLPAIARQAAPRRRRRPEEAEREILEAAEQVFRKRPWHAVSVAEIMGRTTLTRKSFYVYFRDRYELIARLLAPLRAELDGLIAEARQGTSDRRTEMRAAFLTVARFYKEHGAL